MKRLTLLIVLLVALGLASGFALEVKPSFTLSGSASLTWGLNLDTMDTGFKNSASSDFTVILVADAQSDTHAGTGPFYGSITISDLELYWIDGLEYSGPDVTGALGGSATVAAKLVFGPMELSVFDHPAMNSEGAPAIEAAQDTGNAIVNAILIAEPAYTFGAYNTNQGTQLKYNMGSNWLAVDLVSEDAWDNAATENAYAVGAEASMAFAPITVGLGVFQGLTYAANPLGGYATVAAAFTGVGSAKVGFDWSYDFVGAAFGYDLYGEAQLNFNKDATAYLLAKVFYGTANLDSALYLMIPVDTILGKINADLTFFALDLNTVDFDLGALAHLGYNFTMSNGMLVAPTLFVAFTSVGSPAVMSLQFGPQVVITVVKAPDTTITLAYTSGDLLLATPGLGNLTAGVTITY
jgi:hypothetical protein